MRGLGSLLIAVVLVTTGCAAATKPVSPPSVDISGKWRGTWSGYGIMGGSRKDQVTAELLQPGSRGTGRRAAPPRRGPPAPPRPAPPPPRGRPAAGPRAGPRRAGVSEGAGARRP